MLRRLKAWLREPEVRRAGHVEGLEFTLAHRAVLESKKWVRELFEGFYRDCREMDECYFGDGPGKRLEIGSGSSLIKDLYPDVITSDLKPLPFVDRVLDATEMPFADGELRAIYAINTFHHLPDPEAFFREALRVRTGGGMVLIEPFHGPAASWLFRHMPDAAERFDREAPDWINRLQTGPNENANSALSYLVFHRDLALFRQRFPNLELLLDRPHTHLRYLLGSGLTFRQLAPDWTSPLVAAVERMLAPLDRWLALQHTIVLRRSGRVPTRRPASRTLRPEKGGAAGRTAAAGSGRHRNPGRGSPPSAHRCPRRGGRACARRPRPGSARSGRRGSRSAPR